MATSGDKRAGDLLDPTGDGLADPEKKKETKRRRLEAWKAKVAAGEVAGVGASGPTSTLPANAVSTNIPANSGGGSTSAASEGSEPIAPRPKPIAAPLSSTNGKDVTSRSSENRPSMTAEQLASMQKKLTAFDMQNVLLRSKQMLASAKASTPSKANNSVAASVEPSTPTAHANAATPTTFGAPDSGPKVSQTPEQKEAAARAAAKAALLSKKGGVQQPTTPQSSGTPASKPMVNSVFAPRSTIVKPPPTKTLEEVEKVEEALSISDMKELITRAGLSFEGCQEKSDFEVRAQEARQKQKLDQKAKKTDEASGPSSSSAGSKCDVEMDVSNGGDNSTEFGSGDNKLVNDDATLAVETDIDFSDEDNDKSRQLDPISYDLELPSNVDNSTELGKGKLDDYKVLKSVGRGEFGVIYKIERKVDGAVMAMKKMLYDFEREGISRDPLRAVCTMACMRPLRHKNLVQIRDILMEPDPKDGLHVVMELCEYDLEQIIRFNPEPYTTSQIKGLVWQLFSGMSALHNRWLMHRDVKPANCLISAEGVLKLCDFGLVRKYGEPHRRYSPEVVTPRYRAPEIFLGKPTYGPEVDVWANGCIMAELHERKQTFPGESPNDQLRRIFETLGMPTEERWPGFNKLPSVQKGLKIKAGMINRLRKRFSLEGVGMQPSDSSAQPNAVTPWKVSGLSETGFELLSSCLAYDPKKRLTCAQVLQHPWFKEEPRPTYIGPKRMKAAKKSYDAGNARLRKQQEIDAKRREEEKKKRELERQKAEAQRKLAQEQKAKEEADRKALLQKIVAQQMATSQVSVSTPYGSQQVQDKMRQMLAAQNQVNSINSALTGGVPNAAAAQAKLQLQLALNAAKLGSKSAPIGQPVVDMAMNAKANLQQALNPQLLAQLNRSAAVKPQPAMMTGLTNLGLGVGYRAPTTSNDRMEKVREDLRVFEQRVSNGETLKMSEKKEMERLSREVKTHDELQAFVKKK